jgi:large subunit ribosomal protein L10
MLLSSTQRVYSRPSFGGAKPFTNAAPSRGALRVCNALSRERKEATVEKIKTMLADSSIVFGIRFKGISVPTIQKLRKSMPEGTSIVVAKNSLMRIACNTTTEWKDVSETGCYGENAWVFVPEDSIKDTIKNYFNFEDQLLAEAKKAAPKGKQDDVKPPTETTTIVMGGKLLTPKELRECEKLPTRKELLATIAALAKQPAKKIAVGVKQLPLKLAIALKKVAELDEDQSVLVSAVVGKGDAGKGDAQIDA